MHVLLGPLVLFAAVMSLTPGPNIIMVTASAATFGFHRTIPLMIGVTIGFGALVLAAGFGLAGLVHAEPSLQAVLKYAGGAYLLYLAWSIARTDASDGTSARAKPVGPVAGALFQWVNPKAWVFAVGAVAAYTTAGGELLREIFVIAGVNIVACLVSVVLWAAFGAAIGRFLATARARKAFNWSMAALLLLSLAPVFW